MLTGSFVCYFTRFVVVVVVVMVVLVLVLVLFTVGVGVGVVDGSQNDVVVVCLATIICNHFGSC